MGPPRYLHQYPPVPRARIEVCPQLTDIFPLDRYAPFHRRMTGFYSSPTLPALLGFEAMAKTETKKMLAAAVAAAESKQAVDLRVLELDPAESSLTDFFLVMSGTNSRQIQTLADEIELRLKREFGQMPNSREGYRQAEWVLLDYVDFVVHVFSEKARKFYDLERLWKTARRLEVADLEAAPKKKKSAAPKPAASKPGAPKKKKKKKA